MPFQKIYKQLLKEYGHQGWWPLLSIQNKDGKNPTKTGSIQGYHPKNYSYPQTELERFEIIIGTILTQNTSWTNVEKALINLEREGLINPKKISKSKKENIAELIRPAGYFNQKAERLILVGNWFLAQKAIPTREELLELKGIGPETADSILLYAYKKPSFIVDAYTRRILTNLNLINKNAKYDEIKQLIESKIPKDFKIYQEYHALIVEHAKRYYTKNKNRNECPLRKMISQ